MDFEKEYYYYNDSYFKKIEKKIKEYYVTQYNKGFTFGLTHDKIRNCIANISNERVIPNSDKEMVGLLNLFNNNQNHYRINKINSTFEYDIIPQIEYLNLNNTKRRFTVECVIKKIALKKVLTEIYRLLQNNNRLFEMIFDLNKFDKFEIVYYQNTLLERTDLYRSLDRELHPENYVDDAKFKEIEIENLANRVFRNNGFETFNLILKNYTNKKDKAFYSYIYHYLRKVKFQMITKDTDDNIEYRNLIILLNPEIKMSRIIQPKANSSNKQGVVFNEFDRIIQKGL